MPATTRITVICDMCGGTGGWSHSSSGIPPTGYKGGDSGKIHGLPADWGSGRVLQFEILVCPDCRRKVSDRAIRGMPKFMGRRAEADDDSS